MSQPRLKPLLGAYEFQIYRTMLYTTCRLVSCVLVCESGLSHLTSRTSAYTAIHSIHTCLQLYSYTTPATTEILYIGDN